ncbi:cytochrome b5 [Metschnikowia bicuspidata var. bicuspidata NRRL YB-4993]|uniref:Cytochrome b5 n=1 Tax=Metschnikowia bicuspidata var. bicuspidata NRRL YB-4993 TaxID=869754 RepID=A0A1A0HGV1_9ASCO|nr:cytochrome b5 [Metschnikowia bicuspidata var. bicuspidata NRRL YB-4993]OBA23404.1 cytochrome b5 [Metschnikowia bicuspidata var. bicuspidata NRRL YB-4993]
MNPSESRTRFNVLDIVRVFAGILLINALASWWFTSSPTWGYTGKYIDQRYLKHRLFGRQVTLTPQELRLRDGTDTSLPIYIGIGGRVYDVTASRHIYGPKGPYAFFSGRDAARAFVTGCFQKEDEFTHDIRGLDPEEARADIQSWQDYFERSSKYWYVGTVIHEPLTGDPPAPCDHQKYPHY